MNHAEAWLKAIDGRLKLLMLGVDMRRYLYLDAHAPTITRNFGGRTTLHEHAGVGPPTDEVYERCRQFIIDTALQLEADDYEFDPWSRRRSEHLAAGELRDVKPETSTWPDPPPTPGSRPAGALVSPVEP